MATNLNITNIPAPRVPFIDERTGLMSREWYRFFLNLFVLTGSGTNPTTLDELQIGPPNQPDLTELLIQINQNIAPQYEDQSGDFLATLDTAQLMSMMARFENAEAAIQGAYLQPVVQTGTIANYNLDSSPTAGGVVYGTGPALAVSAAGTLGQVLISGGAGAPTWSTDAGGSVTSVSVVSANGLAGTVATATTTPAITLSTTITGLLKGNGTAISAAASGTDYAPATSGTSILYGNGSGGFSNVTIGTGVAFAGGTLSATGSGGTVTSVTGTAPVVSSGGATPAISMAAATTSVNGYLTSTDWTTFNGKQAALVSGTNIKTVNGTTLLGSGDLGTITYAYGGTGLTSYTAGDLIYASAANTVAKLAIGSAGQRLVVSAGLPSWATDTTVGTVTSVAALTLGTTGTDLSSTVANGTTTPVITLQVPTASAANRGALSAADWTTFNNKVTMTYPGAGIPNSTGSAWGTSYSTTGSGTVVALATSPSFTTPTLGAALATSIKFGSGTVLSTYETGTWTPTVAGSGTAGTYQLSANASTTYQRVGNLVTIVARIVMASVVTGGGTGSVRISGLPFNMSASSYGSAFTCSVDGVVFTGTFVSGERVTSAATSTLYFSGVSSLGVQTQIPISSFIANTILSFQFNYLV